MHTTVHKVPLQGERYGVKISSKNMIFARVCCCSCADLISLIADRMQLKMVLKVLYTKIFVWRDLHKV